ncbi:SPA2 (YLL021W) and SPH1 (YLR313C) [Zygosaccharomyces parabailii]|nr:SPA2 (YLL021W) and SPH1 (YLR313C) [Zygosaccharomyces parabailii]CDH09978.1 uncharacterized protein ZBAI_01762 [Zygosaccharomyces bailii ISA1307]
MMDGGADVSTVHHRDVHGYFIALQKYFNDAETKHDRSNSPRAQKARAKLLKLSASQFYELSTDVYDELQRRINEDQSQPDYLLPRATFHMKRNQARQKLANLSQTRFNDLVDDILFEIKRRGYNVSPNADTSDRGSGSKAASNKQSNSEKGKENHNSRNTKSSVSDGSLSQIPPTATIQTSKVIPQKASIDWSSEEEENEDADNSRPKDKQAESRKTDALETNKGDFKSNKKPNLPHINSLQQPNTTPLLSASESCHYGDLIDSPVLTEAGNPLLEESPSDDLNKAQDSNADKSANGKQEDAGAEFPTNQTELDQLNEEIAALKRENASLKQNRSLGGFTSNENFERDLNSLSAELGTLSVENEQLREKVSELEFKTKNMVPKQLMPLKTKHEETDNLNIKPLFDRNSMAKYAANDGSIPFESVEEFHTLVQKLFESLQSRDDELGRNLFENISRLSHTVSQLLLLVDVPEFKDEVLLLRASLSHTITAIRYYAVYGALLPKITVQAAISELAFAFCNLVRSCKIKGNEQMILNFSRKTAVIDGTKDQIPPQTPEDSTPSMVFKSSSLHNPSEIMKFSDTTQDDVSPVKPLKITQKASVSPSGRTPTPRKISSGLLFGSMVSTKSTSSQSNGSGTGFSFDKTRELNAISPTSAHHDGSNVNLRLAKVEPTDNIPTLSKASRPDGGFSFEKTRGSPPKDGEPSKVSSDKDDPDKTLNGETDTFKKSTLTSKSTAVDGPTVIPTSPNAASPSLNRMEDSNEYFAGNADSALQMKNRDHKGVGSGVAESRDTESSPLGTPGVDKAEKARITKSKPTDKSPGKSENIDTKSPASQSSKEEPKKGSKLKVSGSEALKSTVKNPNHETKPKQGNEKLSNNHERKSKQHNSSKTDQKDVSEKHEIKSKQHNNTNKIGEDDVSDNHDHQDSKSKKAPGRSFTDKLRTFANNAGIGLRVEKDLNKQIGGVETKDNGLKSDENKIADKKRSLTIDTGKSKKINNSDVSPNSSSNKSMGGIKKSGTIPSFGAKESGIEKSHDKKHRSNDKEDVHTTKKLGNNRHSEKQSTENLKKQNSVTDKGAQNGKEIRKPSEQKKRAETSKSPKNEQKSASTVKLNGHTKKDEVTTSGKSNSSNKEISSDQLVPNDKAGKKDENFLDINSGDLKANGTKDGVIPSVTLNDGNGETDITPRSKLDFVGAKKVNGVQEADDVPEKLPNFYFNNIPVPAPTNSLLTDKLKKSFADIPSEDETDDISDINNSPYMSDDGSSFHAFKQSWREESTGRSSPLAQQQSFHDENTAVRKMAGGLNITKETALRKDSDIDSKVATNGPRDLQKGFDGSEEHGTTDNGDGKANPSWKGMEELPKGTTLQSLESVKTDSTAKKDSSRKTETKDSRESVNESRVDTVNRQKNSMKENGFASDLSADSGVKLNYDFEFEDESGALADNRNPKANSASMNDKSAFKGGNRLVASDKPYNKSRGYDPSGSPALPGTVEQRSHLNGEKTSKGEYTEDLNADPSFKQNGDASKTPTSKSVTATTPKLQSVKLTKTHASKGDDFMRSPAIPKTPVAKSPALKTPASKGSTTRSPFRSPATRDEDFDDDRDISFDVDAFDIANPDNTLSELLLYLEHQSLQVIATIQSLLTSIKEPHATKGNLRKESNAINQVIRQMVDATSVSMNQSRNASLKEHGSWVVKSLEDCYLRMTTLCQLKRDGEYVDKSGDDEFADKHFKQRLAGIAFDIAKCTKELVKTVEEASLKEEIAFLNARLN